MNQPSGNPKQIAGGCCAGCAGVAMATLFLLVLFLMGSDTGLPGLIVGAIVAMVPVPVYVGLALWLDRYEPEPPLLLVGAYAWGAAVAVFFSYILNTLNSVLAFSVFGSEAAAEMVGAVVSAPLVEEAFKGVAVLILFFWKREEFEGVVDGVVYACMVALGFAMTENIQYYGRSLAEGGGGALGVTFVLRGVLSPFSHPLFTAWTGIGLGLARQSDNMAVKALAPPLGLGIAMALHATWNLTASVHGLLWLGAYLVIMLPAGLAVLTVVFLSLRREGTLLRDFLQPEVEAGRMSSEDHRYLQSIWGRIEASLRALARGGPGAWLACERYNGLASELAFLRSRVQRGYTPPDRAAVQEAELIAAMQAQRSRFP